MTLDHNPVSAEPGIRVRSESPKRPVNASGTILVPGPQSKGQTAAPVTQVPKQAVQKRMGNHPGRADVKSGHIDANSGQAVTNNYLPEWSADDLKKVAKMLRDGDTAAVIAKAMDVTKATVIGRVSRWPALKAIGFKTMNGLDIRKSRAATNYYAETKAAKPRRAAPQHFEEPALGDGISLMDLKPSACKWPSGSDPVVFCCKAKREAGKPYCRNHLIRAYRSEVV